MKQYFEENDALPMDEVKVGLQKFGHDFVFMTRKGLFSVGEVDKVSLILIENIPKISGKLLDLGCGYGAVGIILSKIYDVALFGCDINKHAVEMAKKNAALNNVEASYFVSDSFSQVEGTFDAIVLNPPIHAGKETVFGMFREAKKHLAQKGAFYLVIQKKHGAKTVVGELNKIYESCSTLYKKKGVFVLECRTGGN